MPFIPHTPDQTTAMLSELGIASTDALWREIPPSLLDVELEGISDGLSEMDMLRYMQELANKDVSGPCFIGAGCYDHYIPAAVWDLTTRGEYYTAYTPYQAEASQGALQLIYEFQTMIASLTGMKVANASVYDGATALAESILMAVRLNRRSKSRDVLLAGTVNPFYRAAVQTLVTSQGINVVEERDNPLDALAKQQFVTVAVQQPNFFGNFEAVDDITDQAHEQGSLVIGCVNPLPLTLIKPPGTWGQRGADIACGDGQPLGIPMSSGGPSYGFISTSLKNARQLPGRIVGRTVDTDGEVGYTLTLQAREQHIRRGKATSNICTNQGLLVTASTIYMSVVGGSRLAETARTCHRNTHDLAMRCVAIDGVDLAVDAPFFHETVLRLPKDSREVADHMISSGMLPGLPLGSLYSDLTDCILVCATEKRTEADITRYVNCLREACT